MNFQNIKRLLSAYFIENWRRDLLNYFLVLAGCAFMMSFRFVSEVSAGIQYINSSMDFWMVFAAFVLVSYLFRHLSKTSSSIHYLTIPASTGEKVVANMFLANVYYVVLSFVAIMLGLSIAIAVVLSFKQTVVITPGEVFSNSYIIVLKAIREVLFPMFILISVAFFGAIYFKKRALLKTLGSLIVIGWAFGLLFFLTFWLQVGQIGPITFFDVDLSFPLWPNWHLSEKAGKAIAYTIGSCVIIYNYVLSFLRLRETEA
ncbi:MAG: hypothetical protein J6S56_04950 [Bacteroidales bacterium]|nr:hypothetical protein [Bacteroidales bacterium]